MKKETKSELRPLTTQQQKVFDAIQRYVDTYGFSPSFRELANKMEFKSFNGICCHLRALSKKGYIKYEQGKPRSICILFRRKPYVSRIGNSIRIVADAKLTDEEAKNFADSILQTVKGAA